MEKQRKNLESSRRKTVLQICCCCCCCCCCVTSVVSDSVWPHRWQPFQALLSMGLSRQEHWSGLPFPSPMHTCMLSHFSHVQLCATPWTAAYQAPLSMGFSRQAYWSWLQFPSPLHIWGDHNKINHWLPVRNGRVKAMDAILKDLKEKKLSTKYSMSIKSMLQGRRQNKNLHR